MCKLFTIQCVIKGCEIAEIGTNIYSTGILFLCVYFIGLFVLRVKQ